MAECLFPNCKRHGEKNGFCIGHAAYASIPVNEPEQKAPPAKSSKRKEDEKVYRKKGRDFLKAHPKCGAKLKGCTSISTDIHHKKGRTGDNFLNEKTWLAVCRNCHQQIELTPVKSKETGLSENRLVKQ